MRERERERVSECNGEGGGRDLSVLALLDEVARLEVGEVI